MYHLGLLIFCFQEWYYSQIEILFNTISIYHHWNQLFKILLSCSCEKEGTLQIQTETQHAKIETMSILNTEKVRRKGREIMVVKLIWKEEMVDGLLGALLTRSVGL